MSYHNDNDSPSICPLKSRAHHDDPIQSTPLSYSSYPAGLPPSPGFPTLNHVDYNMPSMSLDFNSHAVLSGNGTPNQTYQTNNTNYDQFENQYIPQIRQDYENQYISKVLPTQFDNLELEKQQQQQQQLQQLQLQPQQFLHQQSLPLNHEQFQHQPQRQFSPQDQQNDQQNDQRTTTTATTTRRSARLTAPAQGAALAGPKRRGRRASQDDFDDEEPNVNDYDDDEEDKTTPATTTTAISTSKRTTARRLSSVKKLSQARKQAQNSDDEDSDDDGEEDDGGKKKKAGKGHQDDDDEDPNRKEKLARKAERARTLRRQRLDRLDALEKETQIQKTQLVEYGLTIAHNKHYISQYQYRNKYLENLLQYYIDKHGEADEQVKQGIRDELECDPSLKSGQFNSLTGTQTQFDRQFGHNDGDLTHDGANQTSFGMSNQKQFSLSNHHPGSSSSASLSIASQHNPSPQYDGQVYMSDETPMPTPGFTPIESTNSNNMSLEMNPLTHTLSLGPNESQQNTNMIDPTVHTTHQQQHSQPQVFTQNDTLHAVKRHLNPTGLDLSLLSQSATNGLNVNNINVSNFSLLDSQLPMIANTNAMSAAGLGTINSNTDPVHFHHNNHINNFQNAKVKHLNCPAGDKVALTADLDLLHVLREQLTGATHGLLSAIAIVNDGITKQTMDKHIETLQQYGQNGKNGKK